MRRRFLHACVAIPTFWSTPGHVVRHFSLAGGRERVCSDNMQSVRMAVIKERARRELDEDRETARRELWLNCERRPIAMDRA